MLIRIRNLRKNQDGQAIILAALGALILAIGVLATVNLGHAIHERVKLQNVADATAYSMAALEARSFNFFAFTNRAQVSQYVTAMSLQSWLAVFWFIDLVLGLLADVANMVCTFACWCSSSVILCPICCPIAAAVCPIYGGLRAAYKAFHKIVVQVDKILGKVVYYIGQFNKFGTYSAQRLMKEMVRINLGSAALLVPEITKENDPEAKWWPMGGVASAALNVTEYSQAFDTDAEKLSKNNINNKQYDGPRRVMTEVTNATRYPPFVSNRNLVDFISKIPLIGSFLGVILKFMPIQISVTGQTKMTSVKDKCGWGGNCRCKKRFGTQFDHSQLARGNVIVADMVVTFGIHIAKVISFDFGQEDIVSVWAHPTDGEHCAYDHQGPLPGFHCPQWYLPWYNCFGDAKNHKWDGIAPYIKFKPDSKDEFQGQPSTYVFLNKKPEDLGGQAYVQKFDFTVGERTESLDTNIGVDPLISFFGQVKGLNAWSRGMAYYHRPSYKTGESNWHEHPNFFNPFWRAKLAPLGEKLDQFVGKLGLSGNASKLFSREFITH